MKLGGWLVMLTGMMLFLTLIGIPTGLTSILSTLGLTFVNGELISSSFVASSFYIAIIAALTAASAGAVIIGLYGKGYDVSLVIVPVVLLVAALFIPTFFIIVKEVSAYGSNWATGIVVLIFISLSIGFIMSCLDYFAGR